MGFVLDSLSNILFGNEGSHLLVTSKSAGQRFRTALANETPLQVVGVVNAYTALLAENAGFQAIYLSGSGVAAASYGLPDLGITTLEDVLIDARRITSACDLPLLVDVDTGWGGAFNIARTVREMERAGVAAIHLEDQVAQKRCGHRPNKMVVDQGEMCDRIQAAVDAKVDADFIIMARTDALAVNGLDDVLKRIAAYEEAGADAIFAEAMTDLTLYERVTRHVNIPVLANITEFGKTDLYGIDALADAGIRMALYPLSAFRAQCKSALSVFSEIRNKGTQQGVVSEMQTRDELYDILGYHQYEQTLDRLFTTDQKHG